jgi:hypothetical protein
MIYAGYFGLNPWQRGTTFAAIANNTYIADRFVYNKVGTMIHDISRSSDVPSGLLTLDVGRGHISTNSLLIDCVTVDAAIAAGDFITLSTHIEGYDFLSMAQRDLTFYFRVKATKTGTYCVAFRNSGLDRSCVVEYTVDSSNVWEEKVISVPESISAGAWDYAAGIGLKISFVLAAGSTFQTGTTDAWVVGDFLSTSNQVNACDNVLNNFYLEGVHFFGFSPVENDYSSIISHCQRYYEKTYDLSQIPGTVTNNGVVSVRTAGAFTRIPMGNTTFSIIKRAVPTVTWYSPAVGTINNIYNLSAAANVAVASSTEMGESGAGYPITGAAIADAQVVQAHYTADAEYY